MTRKNFRKSVLSFRRLIKGGWAAFRRFCRLCAYNYRGFLLWYHRATGSDRAENAFRAACSLCISTFPRASANTYHTRYTTTTNGRPFWPLRSHSLFLGLIVAYLGSSERYLWWHETNKWPRRKQKPREERKRGFGFSGNQRFLKTLKQTTTLAPRRDAQRFSLVLKLGSLCVVVARKLLGVLETLASIARTLFFLRGGEFVNRLIHAGVGSSEVRGIPWKRGDKFGRNFYSSKPGEISPLKPS